MIRVLVTDDSPVMRHIITQILESDPGLKVVGVAENGEQAVSMTLALKPNVITMDIRMPKMNGFEATRRIMQECPTPIVVLCASVDKPDLAISYNALKAGALTIIEKPYVLGIPGNQELKELITTVKLMAKVKVVTQHSMRPRHLTHSVIPQPSANGQRIFAIATSTGGPGALHTILCRLPIDFASPILVVQHISDGFLEGLANWLNQESKLRVKVAQHGERLKEGVVYLGCTGFHLELGKDWTIKLTKRPPVGGFRPSATVLFQSLAQNYSSQVVGIILTGMGNDGAEGIKAIKGAGGKTIAQDEQSCVVFGMPKEAIRLGSVDDVLPLKEIPKLMTQHLQVAKNGG